MVSLLRTTRFAPCLLLLGLLGSGARAQHSADSADVKAAFVFHFAKFVEWPAGSFLNSAAPIRLCTLGRSPLEPALENAVQGKSAQNREIRIERAKLGPNLRSCHILLLGAADANRVAQALEAVASAPVLTVTESEEGSGGGTITLVTENNRLRFDIDLGAAEKAGLRLSSKLLALARKVGAVPEGRASR